MLRLRRVAWNHRCCRPNARLFLDNDVWRCGQCGQRWRLEFGIWLRVSWFAAEFGL